MLAPEHTHAPVRYRRLWDATRFQRPPAAPPVEPVPPELDVPALPLPVPPDPELVEPLPMDPLDMPEPLELSPRLVVPDLRDLSSERLLVLPELPDMPPVVLSPALVDPGDPAAPLPDVLCAYTADTAAHSTPAANTLVHLFMVIPLLIARWIAALPGSRQMLPRCLVATSVPFNARGRSALGTASHYARSMRGASSASRLPRAGADRCPAQA